MISKGIERTMKNFLASTNGQEGARIGYETNTSVTNSGQPQTPVQPKTF